MRKIPLPYESRNWIGGDPECFLVDKRGYIAPIHRFEDKIPVVYNKRLGHRDGAMFEFNLMPELCRGSVMLNTKNQINRIEAFAKELGYTVQMRAQRRILSEYLSDAPKDMMRGGCDPDYDAYSGMVKSPAAYDNTYRYAGGHMHFGLNRSTMPEQQLLELYAGAVSLLDIFVGIPLVAIGGAAHAKEEAARRRYYGQAGSFRVQPHGFEYRVPSSFAYSAPELLSGMFGLARIVMNSYFSQQRAETLSPSLPHAKEASNNLRLLDEMTVRQIIDTADYLEAQRFCLEELFPSIGYIQNPLLNNYTKDFDVIATGMAALTIGAMNGHFLPLDISKTWQYHRGPAIALSQREHWPWFKYVSQVAPTHRPLRGETYHPWGLCPPDCKTCDGLGIADERLGGF